MSVDPESKKLLEDTVTLTRENNDLLHKIRNVQKWTAWWSLLKIIVIVGVTFGLFYFMGPFVDKFVDIWQNVSGAQQPNGSVLQDFLKKIGN